MHPVFMSEQVTDTGYGKCVGEDDAHLRFTVKEKNSNSFVGIGFGLGDKLSTISGKKPFNVAYALDENEWNNKVSLQLMVKDLK